VEFVRRGPDRAGETRARQDRPGEAVRHRRWHGVRQPKAYPVYDDDTPAREHIRTELDKNYPNLHLVGPQRHAQVQQPGPRDDDGDAVRQEHPCGQKVFDLWK